MLYYCPKLFGLHLKHGSPVAVKMKVAQIVLKQPCHYSHITKFFGLLFHLNWSSDSLLDEICRARALYNYLF
jgi:hypothetical protein